MIYSTDYNGDLLSVDPMRIANVIESAKPVVVSVRGADGNEMTIADIAIDVRQNGVHILLDCPEALMNDYE